MDGSEQIAQQIALKELAQEVRSVDQESEAARKELMRPEVVTGTEKKDSDSGALRIKELRSDSILNSARSYAAQMALHWRYEKINEMLQGRYEGALDQAASFRPFVQDDMVLIPSVMESRDTEKLEGKTLVRMRASFHINEEAVLVTAVPTFRDYLMRHYPKPRELHSALLPKNDTERALWDKGSAEGWSLGVEQANQIFADGFAEMEQDIIGRINFLKLRDLNMIGNADFKVTEAGITYNGRQMNVGEVVYTITDDAQYKAMQGWRTAWQKEGGR